MKIKITKIHDYLGHRDAIFALTKSEKGFYSAGADGYIVVWDMNKSDGLLVAKEEESIYHLQYYENQKVLLAGTRKGHVLVIDPSNTIEKRLPAHQGGVFCSLKINEGWLTGGEDGVVHFWNEKWELLRSEKLAKKSIRAAIALSSQEVAFGTSDHSIAVYDLNKRMVKHHWIAHQNSVFALSSSKDVLFSGGRDAMLTSWNKTKAFLKKHQVPAHNYTIHTLDYSTENGLLLTGSMDKTVKVWDAESLTLLKVIDHDRYKAHSNCINKVLWIDSNHFISCSDDRKICLFHIEIEL